jgi:hypothetical protein
MLRSHSAHASVCSGSGMQQLSTCMCEHLQGAVAGLGGFVSAALAKARPLAAAPLHIASSAVGGTTAGHSADSAAVDAAGDAAAAFEAAADLEELAAPLTLQMARMEAAAAACLEALQGEVAEACAPAVAAAGRAVRSDRDAEAAAAIAPAAEVSPFAALHRDKRPHMLGRLWRRLRGGNYHIE